MTDTMPRLTMVAGQFYPRPHALWLRPCTYGHRHGRGAGRSALVVPHAGYVSGQTAGFSFVSRKRPSRVLPGVRTATDLPRLCLPGAVSNLRWGLSRRSRFMTLRGDRHRSIRSPRTRAGVSCRSCMPRRTGTAGARPVHAFAHHADLGKKWPPCSTRDLVLASTDLSTTSSQQRAAEIDARTIEAVLSKIPIVRQALTSRIQLRVHGVICAMAFATGRLREFWQLSITAKRERLGDCTRWLYFISIKRCSAYSSYRAQAGESVLPSACVQ